MESFISSLKWDAEVCDDRLIYRLIHMKSFVASLIKSGVPKLRPTGRIRPANAFGPLNNARHWFLFLVYAD